MNSLADHPDVDASSKRSTTSPSSTSATTMTMSTTASANSSSTTASKNIKGLWRDAFRALKTSTTSSSSCSGTGEEENLSVSQLIDRTDLPK